MVSAAKATAATMALAAFLIASALVAAPAAASTVVVPPDLGLNLLAALGTKDDLDVSEECRRSVKNFTDIYENLEPGQTYMDDELFWWFKSKYKVVLINKC